MLEKIINLISNYEFIFITNLISLSLKFYILIVIISQIIKNKSINSKHIFLIILLTCSIAYSDLTFTAYYLSKIWFFSIGSIAIDLLSRLSWLFFVVQNQTLALFLEHLTKKNFKLNLYSKINLFLTLVIITIHFYFIVFKFGNKYLLLHNLEFEQRLIQIEYIQVLLLFIPVFYDIIIKIRSENLPRILSNQLRVFLIYLIFPYLFLELITNKLLFFYFIQNYLKYLLIDLYAIQNLLNILMAYTLFYFSKKIIGLRFLNLKNHVETKDKFDFTNNFKDTLEQLSLVKNLNELKHITQIFFNSAFNIARSKVNLYIRNFEDNNYIYNLVEKFILLNNNNYNNCVTNTLNKTKIFIKDEIEFTNFYQQSNERNIILDFLKNINVDIFLPIYEQQKIIGYITVEYNARPEKLFNNIERDQMLVFTSYLSNIINILKHNNLDYILKQNKELQDELFQKHQEINQYKESIMFFLRNNKDRKIGLIFYKNKKFIYANQSAKDILNIDINHNLGDNLTKIFKETAQKVQDYKTTIITFAKDSSLKKIIIYATLSIEENSVIFIIYYPEISDIIKAYFETLKDPGYIDKLLYLETTKSGMLINQLIPGNSPSILNFKINLLTTALTRNAILLNLPEDDLINVVELIHNISLRQTLHIFKLDHYEKNNEYAIKLFGLSDIYFTNNQESTPILQSLDNIGTLFIENIEFLSLETQNLLAEFITYGYFRKILNDNKIFSNVRIICSTNKNLENLIAENLFSKNLYNKLNKFFLSMSITNLNESEISDLAQEFSDQIINNKTYKNMLTLDNYEKNKIIQQGIISLKDLKEKVQKILQIKSNKNNISIEDNFDPAYNIADPVIAKAVRLGRKALKYQELVTALWNKYKNQNKIATLLGVDRSSVCRRCKEYNLK